jgi:hypothetical protein
MVTLTNKYVIGTHIMFYEIELVSEYINGLINCISTVKNKENIYLDFTFNVSQFFEKIDQSKITKEKLINRFNDSIGILQSNFPDISFEIHIQNDDTVSYTQTNYRRELNTKYCDITDFIIWGETDSFMPREGFEAIEGLKSLTVVNNIHRYVACFADRKMWDSSWDATVHPDFVNLQYIEHEANTNKNFAKSPLSISEMNEINSKCDGFQIEHIPYPKIDGSFLIISSDLIKSGVNIPPCFIHNDDQAFSMFAKLICGSSYIQFIFKNTLKVHARRHPRKRLYVLNENNSVGSCGDSDKGNWWKPFKDISNHNISILFNNQQKFLTYSDLQNKCKIV